MNKKAPKNVRLSPYVVPVKYKIHLAPDLDNFTFEGVEEIEVEIKKSSNSITLHSAELEILKSEIIQGKKTQEGKVSYDDKSETVTLNFVSKILPGKAVLKLEFTGILNDKLRGFYRSRYELNGKTYHMGVTQFESTDARRAIPCFDEPAQKAVFDVSLKIPSDRTAISNTIETEILEHENGFKTIKFASSPKMSSYLLAFIVGHFEKIKKKTKSGILARIYVTPGKKHQAKFALDVAVRCIEFYEKYFGIKYPLPAMDLIAIPDFAAGAMENWGAVTYRETAILFDPQHSSTQNKQWVALVIAHELAHQWFGNLVTMEWWTHLWLNEGFASYMEYVAIDNLFPEWKVWTQFVFIEQARGLALDGLASTHPIEVEVNHPAEISEIFDAVSYSKGASVIRMLAEFIGEKNFRSGLQMYLKKHSYSNATTADLWSALSKSSNQPVGKIMNDWTRKAGYPLVSVRKVKKKLELSQKRFFSSPLIKKSDSTLWFTPVSIISKGKKTSEYHLMQDKTLQLSVADEWIKINSGEKSFIRAQYTPELLENLVTPIKNKTLQEEDRFGLARDAFALVFAGKISTVDALSLASSFANDNSYIVWMELATQVLKISKLLYGYPAYASFKKYSQELFRQIASEVGWEKKPNESHGRTLMRGTILYVAGTSGNSEIISNAKKMFVTQDSNKIDADLRGVVYRLVAENGDETIYKKLTSLYKEAELAEEKDRILRALCSFKQEKLLIQTFDFSLSEKARAQDLTKTFAFIFANPAGRKIALETLKKNWKNLAKRFAGGHLLSRFILPLEDLTTEKDAKVVESFFKATPSEGTERTIAQAVEQIRANSVWLEENASKIQKFLQESTA